MLWNHQRVWEAAYTQLVTLWPLLDLPRLDTLDEIEREVKANSALLRFAHWPMSAYQAAANRNAA
jgi:hypothetical protein